jgi:hypothetical protein
VGVVDGMCWFHRGKPPPQPKPVRRSTWDEPEPPLPSLLRDRKLVPKLRAWAEEFDALGDGERYPAVAFVSWLELEVSPPVRLLEPQPCYPVVGAAARAVR